MIAFGRFLFPFLAAVAVVLAPGAATARLDHLTCFKVVDKLQVAAAVDMFAELQPEFSARRCTLVKVTDFCVPSTKLNVEPPSAAPRPDIVGPALSVDYIGYLVKCEKQLQPSNKVVLDQFGAHRHRRYKVAKIYVPAKKGPPPCGSEDGKLCGGVCPDRADQCRIDATDNVCKCLPPPDDVCGGKPDKEGQCGGPCPDPTSLCQLTVSSTGAKVCACGPPPPPICGINTATGTCGGECPNRADKCVLKSPNECTCAPATTPCALVPGTVPTCGGDCPIAGDICALGPNDDCRCGPPISSPCDQNPLTGACGGVCPDGTLCRLDVDGNCGCGQPPCGSNADGQCNDGACPDPISQVCKVDASGACNCDPPSCAMANTGVCGGVCPAGSECLPFVTAVGPSCRCQ